MSKKNCIFCGKEFIKRQNESLKDWTSRHKFCSKECLNKSKIGKPSWNKGLKIRTNTGRTHIKKGQRISTGTEFKKGQVPWNKNKSGVMPTPWNKGKHFVQILGEKHHNWKGGKTDLNRTVRQSLEMKKWITSVFRRNNYTCQECNSRNGVGKKIFLHAHHIKPFYKILDDNNIKSFEDALACKELWNIDNGITLCVDCHKKTDSYMKNK